MERLKIDENKLKNKWQELTSILTRLNLKAGIAQLQQLIDDAEHIDVDEDLRNELNEILKVWEENDIKIDHRIGQLESEVSGVIHEVSNVKHVVIGVKRQLEDVAQEITKRQRVEELKDIQQDIIEKYKYHFRALPVSPLFESIDEDLLRVYQSPRMCSVEPTMRSLEPTMHSVEPKISIVEAFIRSVEPPMRSVEPTMRSVEPIMRSVEPTMRSVEPNMSSIEPTIRSVEPTIRSVEPIIRSVEPTMRSVEPNMSSVEPTMRSVEPIMRNVEPNTRSVEPNMRSVEPNMRSVEPIKKNPKQVNSYEEIFCKDSQSCSHIYITGDAGVGKTSFCRRLCFLWYMAKCGVVVGNETLKKDVDYISKFDFVFYITLRETRRTHILDMIIDQFRQSDEKYELKLLKSILREKQCLVLLDGMDEWSPENAGEKKYKIPEKFYSENCVYLTTCRPYRLESARLSHKKDIDRLIQMTGLSGRSYKCYVQNVVDYMNQKKSCNRKSSDFEKEVTKYGLKQQLCIPIITSHLVVLWYEKKMTGMPIAVIYGNILEMLFERAEQRQIKFPPSTTYTQQLPDSLTRLKYLNKYISSIYKLCYLSFCSMFKQDENVVSLVFTRDQLESEPYCFSIEETDFLCKIGILSRNEVFGSFSEEKMKLSFIHKCFLEFFAALFISSFDSSNLFTDVSKTWTCLDDVLSRENFLLLLAGFSYDGIKQLFDNVYIQISDDLTLIRRNSIFHNDKYAYREQIKSLQKIVVNCFEECSRSKTIELKMEDFIIDDDYNIDSLRQLLSLNATRVKSINSVEGKHYPEFDQIHCLQYLNVGKVSSVDIEKFTQCMLQNKLTLHTVCIKADINVNGPLLPELPVRNLHHLTSLSLTHVRMLHNNKCCLVKFLPVNVLIENIRLFNVFCDDHMFNVDYCVCNDEDGDTDPDYAVCTLNLSKHTKLTSLCLVNADISCNLLNNSSLRSVRLSSFSKRMIRHCYFDVLDCIRRSQLEHLYIYGFRANYSHNGLMNILTSTVNTLSCIKCLELSNIKIFDSDLLLLHPDVKQMEILLSEVTLSLSWILRFLLENKKSEIRVQLYKFNILDFRGVNLHKLSYVESVKHVSEYLESISSINITHKRGKSLDFETTSCQ